MCETNLLECHTCGSTCKSIALMRLESRHECTPSAASEEISILDKLAWAILHMRAGYAIETRTKGLVSLRLSCFDCQAHKHVHEVSAYTCETLRRCGPRTQPLSPMSSPRGNPMLMCFGQGNNPHGMIVCNP